MVVRRAAQIHHAIKRPLHEVEGCAEDLQRQFLDCFRPRLGDFADSKVDPAIFADHLQGPFSARKDGKAQDFLAIDD